jgi:hypothetical protein
MTALRAVVALAALGWALGAHAVPFHGCTFYRYWLLPHLPACADFEVVEAGCTAIHPPGVPVPGIRVTGWMPDFFVEVSNRAGMSSFATASPKMASQLATARERWAEHGDPPLLGQTSATHQLPRDGHNFSFFFGRTLSIPYGDVGWSLNTVGWTGGEHLPSCFSAVTEFAAETWSDRADSGDRALAKAWTWLTVPACDLNAPITGTIAAIPAPSVAIPAASPCAFPLSAKVQSALAVSTPNAYDFSKQCMGALGGLYPRTGLTEGGGYLAAERVAWRTASLSDDMFRTGVGVRSDDKWQIVWPPSTNARCFQPGSELRPSFVDLSESFPLREVGYDSPTAELTGGHPDTEYLFAVWRRREACVIPEEDAGIRPEVATYFLAHTGACSMVNAASGAP